MPALEPAVAAPAVAALALNLAGAWWLWSALLDGGAARRRGLCGLTLVLAAVLTAGTGAGPAAGIAWWGLSAGLAWGIVVVLTSARPPSRPRGG